MRDRLLDESGEVANDGYHPGPFGGERAVHQGQGSFERSKDPVHIVIFKSAEQALGSPTFKLGGGGLEIVRRSETTYANARMGVSISQRSSHQPMLPRCPDGRDKSHFPYRTHLKAWSLQIAT